MKLNFTVFENPYSTLALSTVLYEGARLALRYGLCVPTWELQDYYRSTRDGCDCLKKIVIAYHNDIPVGSCALNKYNQVMVFVKTKFRNMGIGTALIKELNPPQGWSYGAGINGSLTFYEKVQKKMK